MSEQSYNQKQTIDQTVYFKTFNVVLQSIQLRLPKEYQLQINSVVEVAKSIFKDNLVNITLGGSAGKNNVIEGWSDLDMYIVLNNYNATQISSFMKIIIEYPIHVGTTYYTLDEIRNNIIDNKTRVMCFEKQNYGVNPTLYGLNDIFNPISYQTIKESDTNNFPNILHDFRRRYIDLISDPNKKVDKSYIKKLLVLIKCLLSHYDIFAYGYEYSISEFYTLLSRENYELTENSDFDIIDSIKNIDESKEDVVKFSSLLLGFIENNLVLKGEKKWTRELAQEQ